MGVWREISSDSDDGTIFDAKEDEVRVSRFESVALWLPQPP